MIDHHHSESIPNPSAFAAGPSVPIQDIGPDGVPEDCHDAGEAVAIYTVAAVLFAFGVLILVAAKWLGGGH